MRLLGIPNFTACITDSTIKLNIVLVSISSLICVERLVHVWITGVSRIIWLVYLRNRMAGNITSRLIQMIGLIIVSELSLRWLGRWHCLAKTVWCLTISFKTALYVTIRVGVINSKFLLNQRKSRWSIWTWIIKSWIHSRLVEMMTLMHLSHTTILRTFQCVQTFERLANQNLTVRWLALLCLLCALICLPFSTIVTTIVWLIVLLRLFYVQFKQNLVIPMLFDGLLELVLWDHAENNLLLWVQGSRSAIHQIYSFLVVNYRTIAVIDQVVNLSLFVIDNMHITKVCLKSSWVISVRKDGWRLIWSVPSINCWVLLYRRVTISKARRTYIALAQVVTHKL